MTDVPEYLLERSRARRAALGLPTTGGPAAASEGSASAPAPSGAAADATPAVASTPSLQPAAVSVAPAAPVEQLPPYMREPGRRTGIPAWMMPVLLLLPLWGMVYLGAFGETSTANAGPDGAALFQKCAACHGARGAGGIGPKLSGGEVTLTFPTEADHIDFVAKGSSPIKGQPYGDPSRPGGQRVANSGGMPAFAGSLSPEEIAAVVKFEREGL